MSGETEFRSAFVALEVNDVFDEANVRLADDGLLCFHHRVDERWIEVVEPGTSGLAQRLLPLVARFRLNAKHLDVHFLDGSRWEAWFGASRRGS